MLKQPLTRRSFIAGSAAGAAALAISSPCLAFAEGGHIGVSARPESQQIHTVCQGCPNGCGFTAYTVDGSLGKIIGDASSPASAGNLCARGYGFTQSANSQANIKNPLRRKDGGDFQTISWDEAFSEIAEKLNNVIEGAGPEAVGLIYDGMSTTAAAYGPRFMAALGSGNIYVDDVTLNIGKAAAFSQVIGTASYYPDFENASLIILVNTSYADITTPDLVASLQKAREAEIPIIAIDSRMGTIASFADEWFAVNPGSELALLLAVCNELIQSGRYDKEFISANVEGFDVWEKAIAGYTSRWAESITGLPNYRIDQLVSKIAEAAPSVAIELENGSIGAASFVNSSETARTVCLLNALIGAWNVPGGALMPFNYSPAAFDAVMEAAVENEEDLATAFTLVDYPLGQPFGASAGQGLQLTDLGVIKALFIIEADVAYDYVSIPDLSDRLSSTDLLVVCSQQMTETAALADYILPVCSYLETAALPFFVQKKTPAVSLANPVIEDADSNARSVDEIIVGLASASGLVDVFDFTLEEAIASQLGGLGLTLEGLEEDGTADLSVSKVERLSFWPTDTGKIQCVSKACEEAGLPGSPQWVEPLSQSNIEFMVSDDMNFGQENQIKVFVSDGVQEEDMQFHLISGQMSVLGNHGYNVAELMDIAEMYDLDSVWINSQVASILGIETGDDVVVSNDITDFHTKAFVTNRIVPTAIYLPSYFGHGTKKQSVAYEKGFNPTRFCEAVLEEGYGTLCTQEASVRLWKEGA